MDCPLRSPLLTYNCQSIGSPPQQTGKSSESAEPLRSLVTVEAVTEALKNAGIDQSKIAEVCQGLGRGTTEKAKVHLPQEYQSQIEGELKKIQGLRKTFNQLNSRLIEVLESRNIDDQPIRQLKDEFVMAALDVKKFFSESVDQSLTGFGRLRLDLFRQSKYLKRPDLPKCHAASVSRGTGRSVSMILNDCHTFASQRESFKQALSGLDEAYQNLTFRFDQASMNFRRVLFRFAWVQRKVTDDAFAKLFWTGGEKLLPDLDFCVSGLKTNPNVVRLGRALEYFVEQMDETIKQLPKQNFREEVDGIRVRFEQIKMLRVVVAYTKKLLSMKNERIDELITKQKDSSEVLGSFGHTQQEIDVNIGVKCGSKRKRKAKLDELGQKEKDFEEKILRYVETVNDCRRKAKYKDQRRPGLMAQVSSYASNIRLNDIAPEQISGEQFEKAVNELMKCYSQQEEQLKALQVETALPPIESYFPQFDLLLWKHLYNASS